MQADDIRAGRVIGIDDGVRSRTSRSSEAVRWGRARPRSVPEPFVAIGAKEWPPMRLALAEHEARACVAAVAVDRVAEPPRLTRAGRYRRWARVRYRRLPIDRELHLAGGAALDLGSHDRGVSGRADPRQDGEESRSSSRDGTHASRGNTAAAETTATCWRRLRA
jgi:hypothetical protein